MKTQEPQETTTESATKAADEPTPKVEPAATGTPAKPEAPAPAAAPPAPDFSGELDVARKLIARLEGQVAERDEKIKGLEGQVSAVKAVAHETEVLARLSRGATGSPEALRGLYRETRGKKFEANTDPAKEAEAALKAMMEIEPALFEARNTNMGGPRSADSPRRPQGRQLNYV